MIYESLAWGASVIIAWFAGYWWGRRPPPCEHGDFTEPVRMFSEQRLMWVHRKRCKKCREDFVRYEEPLHEELVAYASEGKLPPGTRVWRG